MEIRITKLDCEDLYEAWIQEDKDYVKDTILEMNPLESMKLARQIMMFHSEDGSVINQIINYILQED